MSDNLKNYIDSSRSEFEVFPLDLDEGFAAIKRQLDMLPKQRKYPFWKIAAAMALVLGAALIAIIFGRTTQDVYSSEFLEAQVYYQEMLDSKLVLVRDKVDDEFIVRDLEAMDQAFLELKRDLEDDVDNDEVIGAMIDNYRLKLRILEEILSELEIEENEGEETNL